MKLNTFKCVILGLSLIAVSSSVHAQMYDNSRMLSFETTNELRQIHTEKGTTSLSDCHFRNGKKSLEWTFNAGGKLFIDKDLQFEPHLKGSQDNYLSAFIVWLYNERPLPNKTVVFKFQKQGKLCTSFPMSLNFKGWRGAWVCYERDMKGKPETGMNEIVVEAPDVAGKLYIDHMITAIKVDPRYQTADELLPFVNPESHNEWLQVLKRSKLQSDITLTPLTTQQTKQIHVIEQRFRQLIYTPSKLYPKQMEGIRDKLDTYKIKRKKGYIIGTPIWYVRHAEAYERMLPKWDKEILTRTGFEMNDYFKLMQQIAIAYNNASTGEDKKELREMFMLMYDNITDQGVTWGSCWGNIHHYGYSLRSMYIAYFLMKEVLKAEGKLDEAVATMVWYSQLRQVYVKPTGNGMDMDTFNTATMGCMASILLMEDSPIKVQYLRSFSRWLDWGCRPAPGLMDSFKIDGSAYHHCNNYPAYAIGGLNGATQMIYLLSGSEFAIGELAHQTVKNALMAMRFYCNKLSFPLSLSGRHPDGKGQLSPMHYAYMAWAGTPNGANELDESMAAAYLRLTQNTTNNKEKQIYREFRLKGISPEADPQGNLSLGYSCAAVQRRDNWAAVVRGTSRYLWCSEHYTGENLYGRYLGYGSLLLSTAPKGIDVTLKTSGWQEEGFDWNRIPGATSIHLPYDDLKAKILNVDTSSGVEEMLLSDEAFAGGLSQQKTNGNFGLKLHEHDKYNGSFRARKSFHFFNDDIICLGSNIENNDKQHPTETTVFQLAADDPQTQSYWQTYQPQSNTCLDALGTGYYSPNPWTFTGLIQQQSRNNDTNKPNTGQWVSLYIPHGTAPTGAEYEYAVLPKVNPERLKAIASKPFYTVIKKDRDAHIVRHEPTHTLSYVIFETPKSYLPGGPVLLTDTTCLAMVRQVAKNKLILTVAQPDLNLYSGPNDDIYQDGKRVERSVYSRSWIKNPSQELPVRITLLGDWDFTPTANIRLVERKAKTTTLEFMCKDGLSYELELNKR